MTAPLLAVDHVDFAYRADAPVLHDVSLALAEGDTLGLVGESGAGKTSLLRILLGLQAPTAGEVSFAGAPLRTRDRAQVRALRRAVQPVYQDPFSSLDPRMRVGEAIAEPLRALGIGDRAERQARVTRLLADVGLPADAAERFPEAFSGGQRQRIAIARALAPEPRLILADEPVSALDTSVRMQVIELFQRLARERGIGLLLVSHDLTVVAALCARIAVIEGGRLVETGATRDVLAAPQHPYTARLLASVPRLP